MTMTSDSLFAVIGAGAMGSGIAQVAAQSGHRVILVDASEAALARSRKQIAAGLDKLVSRGKLDQDARDAVLARMRWSEDIAEAADAGIVVEAIVENPDVKARLFAEVERVVGADTILASNTSSLGIADLARGLEHPERFVGLHFFNPVPVMKLVEVVPGPDTDPALADQMIALMQDWGKVAVRVRDVPGFIVNRVARPYYAEGFAALGEGVPPALIDHVLVACGSFRMGPLTLADMIGHDVNYAVAESVFSAYGGKTRFRPQPTQQALFDAGNLGRKSGSGVYDYSDPLPEPEFVAAGTVPGEIAVPADRVGLGELIAALDAAGLEYRDDPTLAAGCWRVGESVMAFGDGRPLAERPAIDVLFDHVRSFADAPSLAASVSDGVDTGAVAAFAASLGKTLVILPDRPGQIVLRTLLQLANAAADAVADEVASAENIDAAMRFGANHPEGPLAWAQRVGHREVRRMLAAIAEATGDAMYRPSDWFGDE